MNLEECTLHSGRGREPSCPSDLLLAVVPVLGFLGPPFILHLSESSLCCAASPGVGRLFGTIAFVIDACEVRGMHGV